LTPVEKAVTEMQSDRKLIFVQEWNQWELDRKRIIGQLWRYGFQKSDRVCVSVAIDEAMIVALELKETAVCKSVAVAYYINNSLFHVRIRLMSDMVPHTSSPLEQKSLLAAACMSGFRVDDEEMEIEMWKENTAAGAVSGRNHWLWQ
jgi:hypothetical protein